MYAAILSCALLLAVARVQVQGEFPLASTGDGVLVSRIIPLPHDVHMPRLGLGTAGLGSFTADTVAQAAKAGVRMIDTAQAPEWYSEERASLGLSEFVGASLGAAAREDFYIVTKVHPRSYARDALHDAVVASQKLLKVRYLLLSYTNTYMMCMHLYHGFSLT